LRTVGEVALHRDQSSDELREAIGSMLEEAERLDGLTASLLALARLESEGATLAREPVDFHELTLDVSSTLAVLAAEKEQSIETLGDGAISLPADRVLLRQALLNIVHNAIRYSSQGASIKIETKMAGSEVSISVADSGPGIPREHQAKIFERFYRIDKARSRQAGGHGLGLAIAKWSVERLGGRIEVRSSVGRGSTFCILLPLS
jgi:signal transduction histidine kinase